MHQSINQVADNTRLRHPHKPNADCSVLTQDSLATYIPHLQVINLAQNDTGTEIVILVPLSSTMLIGW
jgi:hypothetical protein